jgi:glyoxylase-like metal-dependent hydrolase (beta-lactamase superfamily II)
LSSSHPVELLPGLCQIKLKIPIKALGYVYSYLVLGDDDALLIDTGWPSKESFNDLQTSLREVGISSKKIKAIVISHLHPDHFGQAEKIRELAPDSRLLIHQADANHILGSYDDYRIFISRLSEWLSQHGTPERELKAMIKASSEMLSYFRPPKPTGTLVGGEIIKVGRSWNFKVVPTPGHTIGTICLYDMKSRVLFSGDHVLPTITPNVSLGPFYQGDPLRDYLNSLDRVSQLEVELVLPSHEYVFSNLQKRVQEIKLHHDERLNEALQILRRHTAISAYDVASRLKWYSGPWNSLGDWERRAAVMETLAHLEYLRKEGRIIQINDTSYRRSIIKFAI